MNTAVPLRRRILTGKTVTGAIVRMPCEDLVEMLAVAGMDFVIIDGEHGPADIGALRQHIAFAEVHRMAVLVRTGAREPALVLRALDQGAQGIVAPHVDDAAAARAVVAAAHYPPAGARGFATYPRAGRFGTVPALEHRARAAEQIVVLVMLESPGAVKAADMILATPGVDGYLIGSADLAASSGSEDPPVTEQVAAVHAAATAVGSRRVDLVSDKAAAQAAVADGAHLVVYNLAEVLMRTFRGLLLG